MYTAECILSDTSLRQRTNESNFLNNSTNNILARNMASCSSELNVEDGRIETMILDLVYVWGG